MLSQKNIDTIKVTVPIIRGKWSCLNKAFL